MQTARGADGCRLSNWGGRIIIEPLAYVNVDNASQESSPAVALAIVDSVKQDIVVSGAGG